jgi:hypothetical protein
MKTTGQPVGGNRFVLWLKVAWQKCRSTRRARNVTIGLLLLSTVSLAAVLVLCRRKSSNSDLPRIGFVLSSKGRWVSATRPSQFLTFGDEVLGGDLVRPETATEENLLEVCLRDGSAVSFSKESRLPRQVTSSYSQRLWAALTANYRPIAVAPISRGGDDSSLADGLCKIVDGGLELAPAFAAKPRGSYRVQLEQITPAGKAAPGAAAIAKSFHWNPSDRRPLNVGAVPPGLYALRLLNRDSAATGDECWIVIIDADQYDATKDRLRRRLDDAENTWHGVSYKNKRDFRRAYLAAIADMPDE